MRALPDEVAERGVEGVGEGDVGDDAVVEEGKWADPLGAVDNLVGNDEVARFDGFLERADGREGDDGAAAEGAQGGDVGAGGDFVRGELVVGPVAGEEGDGDGVAGSWGGVFEDADGGGGSAPRGGGVESRGVVEVGERGKASAAYYGDSDWAWG